MNGFELKDIIGESISLGILFFILLKGSGLAFRVLQMLDDHLGRMLNQFDLLLIILAEIRDGRNHNEP
jgi:hypothetical protein